MVSESEAEWIFSFYQPSAISGGQRNDDAYGLSNSSFEPEAQLREGNLDQQYYDVSHCPLPIFAYWSTQVLRLK